MSIAAQRKVAATAEELEQLPKWKQAFTSTTSPIYSLPSSCSPNSDPHPHPLSTQPRSISRSLSFSSFSAAFGFITRVGLLAARLSHHPEWSNAGGKVDIRLTTDDAGGTVTALDVRMARAIDKAAVECGELSEEP